MPSGYEEQNRRTECQTQFKRDDTVIIMYDGTCKRIQFPQPPHVGGEDSTDQIVQIQHGEQND
jgi:hypothetical protein